MTPRYSRFTDLAARQHEGWLSQQLGLFPGRLRDRISAEYVARSRRHHEALPHANAWLRQLGDRVRALPLSLAATDDELCIAAERQAEWCQRQSRSAAPFGKVLERAARYGITFDEQTEVAGIVARLTDARFWRMRLRRQFSRLLETEEIRAGMVNTKAGVYLSDDSMSRYIGQKRRLAAMLQGLAAVSDIGDCMTLEEIASKTVSNPELRRAEMMTRAAGYEWVAREHGHAALFLTMTAPSRFHAWHHDGRRNIKHELAGEPTPRDAQKWLCKVWSLARAALARRGIHCYGLRVAEAHHDGTPHWHALLFCEPSRVADLWEVIGHYWYREDSKELRGLPHQHLAKDELFKSPRYVVKLINMAEGSAAGYIAKYIGKNINGAHVDVDHESGLSGVEAAARVTAWASRWSVRQFQQIGCHPVTLWRELRKVERPMLVERAEALRQASQAGEWWQFVKLLGGAFIGRRDLQARMARAWSDQPNRYREPRGWVAIGVECEGRTLETRTRCWEIMPRGRAKRVSRVLRAGFSAAREISEYNRQAVGVERQRAKLRRAATLGDVDMIDEAKRQLGEAIERRDSAASPWTGINNCTVTKQSVATAVKEAAETSGRKARLSELRVRWMKPIKPTIPPSHEADPDALPEVGRLKGWHDSAWRTAKPRAVPFIQ
ncbi:replication endonuclease [Leeia sp.]|uniref:replication endonuclease n=1 Tax=Leeia sp. TaxID=2884678 RepID=UPI0035B0ED10